MKNTGKISIILLFWIFFHSAAVSRESNLGPFRFKNMFLKGTFGTEENLIDNLSQNPNLSSWDSLSAQNSTNGLGLIGYKYRSSQTQLSYAGNLILTQYRIISHAFKLQESIKFGRYALITTGGLLSLSTGKTIPYTNKFLDSRVWKGDAGLRLYLTKIVNTRTTFDYTDQSELNGDHNVTREFAHKVNYAVNGKMTLFIKIHNIDSKLDALGEDRSYEFGLLTGSGGVTLKKYLGFLSGNFGTGITLTQKGNIYTERNANAALDGNLSFEFKKIKQNIALFSRLTPTFNSDKQWDFNKTVKTDQTSSLIYNNNPLVHVWGTYMTTAYNFSPNLNTSMGISWEKRNFPVGRREDILLGINPVIKFNITRFNTLHLFYELKRNWSTVPDADIAEGDPVEIPQGEDPRVQFEGRQNYDYVLNKMGFKLLVEFSTERK